MSTTSARRKRPLASGTPAGGRSKHVRDCTCTRCTGFEPGNEVAVKHGARSVLRIAPRAKEIAESLRVALGDRLTPEHEPGLEAAALAGARTEAALGHLLSLDEATIEASASWLDDRARRWLRAYAEFLSRFGLLEPPKVAVDLSLPFQTLDETLAQPIDKERPLAADLVRFLIERGLVAKYPAWMVERGIAELAELGEHELVETALAQILAVRERSDVIDAEAEEVDDLPELPPPSSNGSRRHVPPAALEPPSLPPPLDFDELVAIIRANKPADGRYW